MAKEYITDSKSGVFNDHQDLHISNDELIKINDINIKESNFIENTKQILATHDEAVILCQSKIKNPNFFSIIYCNNAFQKLFQISENDVLGKSYDFLFEEFDLDYASEDQIEYFRLIKDIKDFHPCSIIIGIPDRSQNKKRRFKIDFEPEGFVDQLGRKHAKFTFGLIDANQSNSRIDSKVKNTIDNIEREILSKSKSKAINDSILRNAQKTIYNERILRKVSSFIISDLSIGEIAQNIAKSLCEHLRVDRCIIHDYQNSQTNFIVEYDSSGSRKIFSGPRNTDNLSKLADYINFHNNICKKYAKNNLKHHLLEVGDVKNNEIFDPIRDICKEFKIASQISITTTFNNKINGGIYIHQSQSRNWLADEIEIVEIIADQFAVAIDRSFSVEKVMESNHALMEKAKELRQALKKEQEIRKMQNEFVALVSHEFKTPLQIIDGNRELLHRKIKSLNISDQSIDKGFIRIKNGIQRMNGLINSTLNLAKMETGEGKIKVEKSIFDLQQFLFDIIQKNINLATSKNISVLTNIKDLPRNFNGDAKLLEHSFNNVVSNAIKYSPNNSKVKIIAKYIDNKSYIRVIDSGIGIPADDIANVGQKFFRAKNTLSVSGTGIGLYLTKHFVELHNGNVKIESEVDVGTSVTIMLPNI